MTWRWNARRRRGWICRGFWAEARRSRPPVKTCRRRVEPRHAWLLLTPGTARSHPWGGSTWCNERPRQAGARIVEPRHAWLLFRHRAQPPMGWLYVVQRKPTTDRRAHRRATPCVAAPYTRHRVQPPMGWLYVVQRMPRRKCGAPRVERTNRKSGERLLGCSGFPACGGWAGARTAAMGDAPGRTC
ncbi:hypothetical protein D3C71_1047650 [compost metagenome]